MEEGGRIQARGIFAEDILHDCFFEKKRLIRNDFFRYDDLCLGSFAFLSARLAAFWTWRVILTRWRRGARAGRGGAGGAGADARGWRGMRFGSLLQTQFRWTADDLDVVRVAIQAKEGARLGRGRLRLHQVLLVLGRHLLPRRAHRVNDRLVEFC